MQKRYPTIVFRHVARVEHNGAVHYNPADTTSRNESIEDANNLISFV